MKFKVSAEIKSAYLSLLDTKRKLMDQNKDHTELRQHERAKLQSTVVGILSSNEPVIIGYIDNISLGGLKLISALTLSPINNLIHSIDLITDNSCLMDIHFNCGFFANKNDSRRGDTTGQDTGC